MRDKRIKYLALIAVASMALSGCQRQTENPIVVPKTKASTEHDVVNVGENHTLFEQVQSPAELKKTLTSSDGRVIVNVEATVIVPEVEGIKLKKAVSRDFTQAELDKQKEVLFQGENLITFISESEKKEAEEITEPTDYDGSIEKSSEEIWETNGESDSYSSEENYDYMEGEVIIEEGHFLYRIIRWGNFFETALLRAEEESPMAITEEEELLLPNLNTPEADLAAKAEKTMQDLGYSELAIFGSEPCIIYSNREEGGEWKGYSFHATRVIDGISVNHTRDLVSYIEETENIGISDWHHEHLSLTYDDGGLQEFRWINPHEISSLSEEYVFLLPFADIQDIFETMIMTKYDTTAIDEEGYQNLKIDVYEVRLGYTRVRGRGEWKEGMLVPVWDFYGKIAYDYQSLIDDMDYKYNEDYAYNSILTINAMDGAIVNRSLGY